MPGTVLATIASLFLFRKKSKSAKLFSYLVLAVCLLAMPGCTKVELYESSTGMPARNYEIIMQTPGELEPVTAKFHIVRTVNAGNHRYIEEYYDIYKDMVISRAEAERTMSLRLMIHILNPAGLNLSLNSRKQSLEDRGSRKIDVLHSGREQDILKFVDCPMAIGQHKAGLLVYRDKFMLFDFADFSYTVE